MQAEGGAGPESKLEQLLQDGEDASLPNAQQSKWLASELFSEASIVSEKRGRIRLLSESSSEEESGAFPTDSPKQAALLTLALQSTRTEKTLDTTLAPVSDWATGNLEDWPWTGKYNQ